MNGTYRTYEGGAFELAHRDYGDGAIVADQVGLYPAAVWERPDRDPLEVSAPVGADHPADRCPYTETYDVPRTYAPLLVRHLGPIGIRELHGLAGRDTLRVLGDAAAALGTDVRPRPYHVPVGRPPEDLDLALARECGVDPESPEGIALLGRALEAGAAREARPHYAPTPGNVGALLAVFGASWATEHPGAVWNVDSRPNAPWHERASLASEPNL